MNKQTYVQTVIPVSVPVFACIGCGVRVPGVILRTEVHRRLLNTGSIYAQYIDGVDDGSHLAINYEAPEGWQLINIPGRQRHLDTDNHCCGNCAQIIQHVVNAALVTAQTAISVNTLNVQNALAPPLQGVMIDERQAIIPHEFVSTDYGASALCEICTLTETECRDKQTALIANTKG